MATFTLQHEQIDLPPGAYFKSRRQYVLWNDKPVIGFSQNDYRAYLFPVYTPAGFSVTTETPVDHPHHNSVWVGADHVNCLLPFAENQFEQATYNFYINETFQGRAAGRIVAKSLDPQEVSDTHFRLVQSLDWKGPREWGATDGRLIAVETRTVDIHAGEQAHTIDIRSQLSPTEWELQIGPTRHAYFGIRMAEPFRESFGADVVDSAGRRGCHSVSGQTSDWIHITGEPATGHQAGLAVFRAPNIAQEPWAIRDWGTIDINPLRDEGQTLKVGEELDYAIRLIVHDGDPQAAGIAARYREFVESRGS